MGRKTPPFPPYPAWTTAKAFSFFRSGLRAKWSRWPPKFDVLKDARINVYGQRHRYEYTCAECEDSFKLPQVEVDHIYPCGSFNTFEDAGGFMERLFVGKDKLRVLCKPCHKRITKEARDATKTT